VVTGTKDRYRPGQQVHPVVVWGQGEGGLSGAGDGQGGEVEEVPPLQVLGRQKPRLCAHNLQVKLNLLPLICCEFKT